MDLCHVCEEPGAELPDPCCSAPDCEDLNRRVHLRCLSPARQREELAFMELMFVDLR